MALDKNRSVLVLAVAFAALLPPHSLLATRGPVPEAPASGPSVGASVDRAELEALRAEILDRQKTDEALAARVDRLTAQLRRLQQADAANERDLARVNDRVLELERRLDRLVPRLEARSLEIAQQRAGTAQALATLAERGRRVDIDATLRSRLRAVSPLLLNRLSKARSALTGLEQRHQDLVAERKALEDQDGELRSEKARLARKQAHVEESRDLVSSRRDSIQADLRDLTDRHAILAQRVEIEDVALELRLEAQFDEVPWYDRPAPGPSPSDDRDAVIIGSVKRGASASHGAVAEVHGDSPGAESARAFWVEGRDVSLALSSKDGADVQANDAPATLDEELALRGLGAVAGAEALALERSGRQPRTAARGPEGEMAALLPPPAKPKRLAGGFSATAGRQAGLEVQARSAPQARPEGAVARLTEEPMLPVLGEIVTEWKENQPPQIAILAGPGQSVAAPIAGEVVWADRFRSYGPLLIIEHEDEYHTLLWGFASLDVKRGEQLRIGQIVGVMPQGGTAPRLTIELRQNGQPVDPPLWLAESSSKVRS